MRTEFVAAITIIAGAVMTVRSLDHVRLSQSSPPSAEEAHGARAAMAQPAYYGGDEVRISAARDNQYYVSAEVNRQAARFLIDTGASFVALRESDAREAGIYTSWTDYTYPVKTANGETKAALVTIDEIDIDGLRVKGVRAFVLPDEQLEINLLGMSFLSRLESVEARRGELVLRG